MIMAGDILKTTKIELRSVLLSFPIGVTYKQLNSEYHMRIGRAIPVSQCGYDTLEKLLRDMPDVVRTVYDRSTGTTKLYGVPDETTLHIDRMVASQKKSRKRCSGGVASSRRYRSFAPQYTQGFSREYAATPSKPQVQPLMNVRVGIDPIKPFDKESSYQKNREMSFDKVRNDVTVPLMSPSVAEPRSHSYVVPEMPKEVKKVLEHQMSFDQNCEKLAPHVEKFLASFKSDESESVAIRNMVVQLLVECPSGIWLKDFARSFEKKFGGSIDNYWMEYGSVFELLISMNDIVDLIDLSNGDTLVKKRSSTAVTTTGHQQSITSCSSSRPVLRARSQLTSETMKVDEVRQKREIPLDAIGPGGIINRQTTPPVSNKYVLIQVSNVVNPSLFDLQLVGPDTSDALDELMVIMQSTYNHESGDDYAMPRSLMHIGQLCAARYQGEWHRCFITSFKDQAVNVCFFDYGTTGSVNGPLRLLRSRYTGLPIQAIRARLSDLQPVDRVWSTDACKFFMELINNRRLFAVITNNDEDMISVTLIDTSGKDDVNINKMMVDKGHAVYIPDIFKEPLEIVSSANPETIQKSPSPPSLNLPLPVVHETPAKAVKSIDISACSVRNVKLTSEFSVHLIKIEEKAYIASAEISLFMWKEDLVRAKLRELGITNLPKLILLPEEHADIFRLLELFSIPGVIKQGKFASILVLFELQSVAEILNIFQHPSQELQAAIRMEVKLFNPRDTCWRAGQQSSGSEVGLRKETKSSFQINQIEETFERVREKRNTLLKSLQSQSSNDSSRIVEEIKKVEDDMSRLNQLIKKFRESGVTTDVGDISSKDYGSKFRTSVDQSQFESGEPAQLRRTPLRGAALTDLGHKEGPDVCYGQYVQKPCLETSSYGAGEQVSASRQQTSSLNTPTAHPLFTNQTVTGVNGQSVQDLSTQLSRLSVPSASTSSPAGQQNLLGAQSMQSIASLAAMNLLSANPSALLPFLNAGNFPQNGGLVGNNVDLFGINSLPGTQLPSTGGQGGFNWVLQARIALLNAIGAGQLPVSGLGGSLLGLDVITKLSEDSATRRQ